MREKIINVVCVMKQRVIRLWGKGSLDDAVAARAVDEVADCIMEGLRLTETEKERIEYAEAYERKIIHDMTIKKDPPEHPE